MKIRGYIGLLGLLCLLLLCGGCGRQPAEDMTEAYDPYAQSADAVAVIKSMDLEAGTMSFVSVTDGKEYDLLYNNGVDVRNKHKEIISGSQLKVGQIVDIVYNTLNNKLLEVQIDPDAWEVRNISGFEFDAGNRQATILNQIYQYTNDLIVVSGDELIRNNEICKEDQLTARGYGGKLCSLTVDLGHGYVKLENYDTYIGGMIEIGYDVIVPVTEDMLLTVREGTYKLKITKGSHSGYKNVVVTRDQECVANLMELQIAPDPVGSLFFNVTPATAKVIVDGEVINTADVVELTYGKHHIRLSADGYETKEGYFKVDAAYKIFNIELVRSEESSSSSGTTAGAGTRTTSGGGTGTGTTSGMGVVTTEGSSGTTESGSTTAGETTASTSGGSATTTESSTGTTEIKKTGNTVTITAPVGAYCYVDGDLKGTVPCTFDKTVGSHVVTFSKTGCLVKSYTIQCKDDGKDETYSFDPLKTFDSLMTRR